MGERAMTGFAREAVVNPFLQSVHHIFMYVVRVFVAS
jgi:hypothetical protein